MGIQCDFVPVVNGKLTQVGSGFRSSRESVKSAVFRCECGNHTVTMVRLVKIGVSKTCGRCKPRIGLDDASNKRRTRAYIAWMNMRQRCLNQGNKDYANYGGRGITICDPWTQFVNFKEDMGEPGKGLSLDRIDNSKGYSRENCRWATYSQQLTNKRTSRPRAS
jgi:hypothetical protein